MTTHESTLIAQLLDFLENPRLRTTSLGRDRIRIIDAAAAIRSLREDAETVERVETLENEVTCLASEKTDLETERDQIRTAAQAALDWLESSLKPDELPTEICESLRSVL